MSTQNHQYTVVAHDGYATRTHEFSGYSAAKRFAEKQSVATIMQWTGDKYTRATWFKKQGWYTNPGASEKVIRLSNHLNFSAAR